MILPSKHLSLSESLLGLGGVILLILNEPKSVDDIWKKYIELKQNKTIIYAYHNFDDLILATNYLYLIGAVSIDDHGKIIKCA